MAPTIRRPPRSSRKACASRRSSSTRPASCATTCSTAGAQHPQPPRFPRRPRSDARARPISASGGCRNCSPNSARRWSKPAIEAILDATEQQTRAVVSTWKDGVFHGEALLDDDGHGRTDIRIAAKVTKTRQRHRGRSVRAPIRRSTSFVNSSHANMQAAVAMAFAYLIDSGHSEEHRRAAAAEGDRKAGHHRVGRSGAAGDAVHQPSLE